MVEWKKDYLPEGFVVNPKFMAGGAIGFYATKLLLQAGTLHTPSYCMGKEGSNAPESHHDVSRNLRMRATIIIIITFVTARTQLETYYACAIIVDTSIESEHTVRTTNKIKARSVQTRPK